MSTETEKKPRIRRTPEQMIADLEAKIEQVKQRAEANKAKQTPEGKAMITAARALDKATEAAAVAGNAEIQAATEAASAILAEVMIEMGARLPS